MHTDGARAHAWVFFALLLLSGLAATVALTRAGIRHFWSSGTGTASVKRVEALAVIALLSSCVALSLWAEPVLRYTASAAAGLHAPEPYIEGVLSRHALPAAGSALETAP